MKNRLKELRKKLGIKQRELAERLGATVGLVSQWEAGITPVPKTRIYQICNEYNVRREWLESGDGDMFEDPDKLIGDKLQSVSNEKLINEAARRVFYSLPPELQEKARRSIDAWIEYVEGKRTELPIDLYKWRELFKEDEPPKKSFWDI